MKVLFSFLSPTWTWGLRTSRAQTQAHQQKEHLLLIIPVSARSWQGTSKPLKSNALEKGL